MTERILLLTFAAVAAVRCARHETLVGSTAHCMLKVSMTDLYCAFLAPRAVRRRAKATRPTPRVCS
jgi:hypothetical protein